jgi:uncharacterized protein (TIGR02757 family)
VNVLELDTTRLRRSLDRVLAEADNERHLGDDPIQFAKRYKRQEDQEVVAFVSSALAYGRVALIAQALEKVFSWMGLHPAEWLRETSHVGFRTATRHFHYRMTGPDDMVDLFAGLQGVLQHHSNLETAFLAGGDDHLERAIFLVDEIRNHRSTPELSRGLRYLLPSPRDGSCTKRLHLFLRWVIRGPDEVDLGIWSRASRADLVAPLDTHTARIWRYVGLTTRRTCDLKAALEISAALKLIAPGDPLRYDFAVCHLGISGQCVHQRAIVPCSSCPLESICGLD